MASAYSTFFGLFFVLCYVPVWLFFDFFICKKKWTVGLCTVLVFLISRGALHSFLGDLRKMKIEEEWMRGMWIFFIEWVVLISVLVILLYYLKKRFNKMCDDIWKQMEEEEKEKTEEKK